MRDLPVIVTAHALERALDRANRRERTIIREVTDAIAAGRKATRQPAWSAREGVRRNRADRTKHGGEKRGTLRWVWDETEQVAYLIRIRADRVFVITATGRNTLSQAA